MDANDTLPSSQPDAYEAASAEYRLRTILEGTGAGTWEWNVQTGQVMFNERWAEIIGYRLSELSPVSIETWLTHAHPQDLQRSNKALQQHFDGITDFYQCETRMRHKDGHWIWVRDYGRIVTRTKEGAPEWVSGTHIDITAHKLQEESLKRATAKLESIIRSNPAIIYMLTLDQGGFDTSFISPDVEQRLGYPRPDILGGNQWWEEHIHPRDLGRARGQVETWLAGGCPDILKRQYRLLHGDGRYRWVADWMRAADRDENQCQQFVGSLSDITDPVTLSERLTKLSAIMPGMIYQYEERNGAARRFPYASDGALELFGLTPATLATDAAPMINLVHADDRADFQSSLAESAHSLQEWRCEFRVVRDGHASWILGHAKPERTESGATLWHGYMTDITDRKTLENELARSRDTLRQAQKIGRLGYWQSDMNSGELTWSDIVYEIFGVDPATFTPTALAFHNMVHPEDRQAVKESLEKARTTGTHDVAHRIIRPDGSVRWVHELANIQRTEQNRNILLGTVRDITEQKELELRLREQSISDELTGARNRRYFIEQISAEFDRFKRHGHQGSLVLFDFDHFKRVNDQYGHAAGDQVLSLSAGVIQQRIRSTDCLARIGGEEFAILLPSTTLEEALVVAETLRQSVAEQLFHSDRESFHVTITCGVATFKDTDEVFENTMHRADKAMYLGKAGGRNQVCHG